MVEDITAETDSVDQTRLLGASLASVLGPGMVVVLVGGLGAGKTALTQGIARGLGVTTRVTSPTFTMVATHEVDGRDGLHTLLHADLYRVGSGVEADDLSIAELVEDAAVAVVEWGDVAPDVLGPDRLVVRIEQGDGDDDRRLVVDAAHSSVSAEALGKALAPWRRP